MRSQTRNKVWIFIEKNHVTTNLVLIITSAIILIPFFWIIITAIKEPAEIFYRPFSLIPERFALFSNIAEAWSRAPFAKYYWNTVVVVMGLLVAQLIIAIPAAYAFARLEFKGKNILFMIVLAKLMITAQSVLLPNYMLVSSLGLLDTKLAIALPYLSSPLGVLLFRQAFKQIPQEVIDAAKIDGCEGLKFIWHIGISLIKPMVVAFSIISIVYHWNEFFWPMLVTDTAKARTLTIGLAMFGLKGETGTEWTLTMAITIVVIVPLFFMFAVFRRQFINSFMQSGTTG